jgi:hypothetical protein
MVPGMVPRRRLAALTTALFLAAAAPAGAQSAGDDQYEDPFGGDAPSAPSGGGSDPGTDGDSSADIAPGTGGDAPTTSPAAPGGTGSSAPQPAASPASEQLPVTGTDAGLVALAGTVLLAGGVALRVRLRDQP